MLEPMLQAISLTANNLWLLGVGILLIIIGAVGPMLAPAGGRGWYALLVIGIIVVIIWIILLILGIAAVGFLAPYVIQN